MKYPRSIQCQIEEVRTIADTWPAKYDIDNVIKWILQFETPDYDLAVRVIKNLNVLGPEEINNGLSIAYSKLMRKCIERESRIKSQNTLFAAIGTPGKSGSMISYHFRLINEISEENFLNDETLRFIQQGKIDNIVLLDDVISTGDSARKAVNKLTNKITPLGVKNIFVLAICGFRDGLERIEKETKAHTFAAFEYAQEDTVRSLDSVFYLGLSHDQRQQMHDRIGYYGQICAPKSPLGYGGLGGLLVFHYNTPNPTLPVIWSQLNGWIPLFKRILRVNGIESFYKQFDKAVEKKVETASDRPAAANKQPTTLTIYVEGKLDEIFFDELARKYDLKDRLSVQNLSIISLAGAAMSIEFINKLVKTSEHAIFICDKDFEGKLLIEFQKQTPVIFLEPNIFGLVDISKLHKSEEFLRDLPRELEVDAVLSDVKLAPDEFYYVIERSLLKGKPSSVAKARIQRIVDAFLDENRLRKLVSTLNALMRPLVQQ